MTKEKMAYDFECINHTTYQLKFKAKASAKVFNTIFMKARIKIAYITGRGIKGDVENIQEMNLLTDSTYKGLLTTIMRNVVKEIEGDISKDNIIITSKDLIKARMFRTDDSKEWEIELIYQGEYINNN